MKKIAGLEDTTKTDPATGLKIRVSTTTRKVYRHIYRSTNPEYEFTRNHQLNEMVAEDFMNSSDKVVHHFSLGKSGEEGRIKAEIRNRFATAAGRGTTMFFISAIRGGYIDILTLQTAWKSPKYYASRGIAKK